MFLITTLISILTLFYASTVLAIDMLTPTVEQANEEYVRLLNHSILFFEAQRAGKLPENNRVPWRHDSTLNDGSDNNVDLAGGYYDAGNYMKFTFPLCYSIFMLSWGGTDYIQGYELANQTVYLKDQIKWATDWLIKAHPEPSTLYVQVGDIKIDNGYFGPDTNIPEPRPVYKITDSNFGTDAAAIASAAFSSASTYFRTLYDLTQNKEDEKYANILLGHAHQLHHAAVSIKPYTKYHNLVNATGHSYSSSECMDDLILSGVSLYKATKDKHILNQILHIYRSNETHSSHIEPLDWDNKWGAIYVFLAETLMDYDDQDEAEKARIEAEIYLDDIVSGITANRTNGGLLFWDGYSKINSNSIAMSASHLLLSYSSKVLRPLAEIGGESLINKANQYEELAKGQLDYMFGKNPMDQTYVVGARLNSPKYPHSAPASGFKDLNEALTSPHNLKNSHIIYGALVGGPSFDDSFTDKRFDWHQTEVALDYNAPYQNVLAYQVMFSNEDPFYPTKGNGDGPTNGPPRSRLPAWQFALVVILPTLFLLGTGIGLFIWFRAKQRKSNKEHEEVIETYKRQRQASRQK